MISTLASNAGIVGSIPAQGAIFPIFVTPMTLIAVTRMQYTLHTACLSNIPSFSICKITVCRGWGVRSVG